MYFTKMTKNNLKLMLRCRALVLIVICMVMVTGMLSAVFKDLLSDNFYIGDFTLGVSFGEDCVYAPAKSAIQAAFDHENTVVIDIPYGSGQKAIESKRLTWWQNSTTKAAQYTVTEITRLRLDS